MSSEGWVKLHRKLQDNPLWKDEPFTRGQAWVDMILMANHADGYIRIQGMRIDVKCGDLAWSEVNLARRWRWSRGKVRRFMLELSNTSMITRKNHQKTDKRKNIITINNYFKYQLANTGDGTGDGTGTRRIKNEKKKDMCANAPKKPAHCTPQNGEAFDLFWEAYPKKRDKLKAKKSWDKIKPDSELTQRIITAVSLHAKTRDWTKEDGKYIPMPSTWLNGQRWEDEIQPAATEDEWQ